MNTERTPGMLGKLDPHPEETHPRVKLTAHMDVPAIAVPDVIDYHSEVERWPMYLNDQIGDCTCAGTLHSIQAVTRYAGSEVDLTDNDALMLYERFGYVPGNPGTDQGAVEQDVLQNMVNQGIEGHKFAAFAQVDHSNMDHVLAALYLFGTLYLGIQCPQSAQQQFAQGQKWTVVPDSPILGGHCIVLQGKDADGTLKVVTWGSLVDMDPEFWNTYVDEAWVIVTDDFLNAATEQSPTGLDINGLMAQFSALSQNS